MTGTNNVVLSQRVIETNRQFRLAKEGDISLILDMMAEFNAIDHYPFDRQRAAKNLQIFIESPDLGRLWLLKAGEEVIGYLVLAFGFSFEYGGRDAFIDEFYLRGDHRRRGTGRAAMEYVISEAKALGVHTVHLEVENHNDAGLRLYTSMGFKGKGRHLWSRKL